MAESITPAPGATAPGAAWPGGRADIRCEWPASPDGQVFDLGHCLEPGMPRHPAHPPYAFTLTKEHGQVPYPDGKTSGASELITTGGHVGTHIDALGHVSHDGKIFGGHTITDAQSYAGGIEYGTVEEVPPLFTTGHLVDAVDLLGRDLQPEDGIGAEQLAEWFDGRPAPEPGDIVLIRTGWSRYWHDFTRYVGLKDGLPGVTPSGARWLSEHGVVAAGADTLYFEQVDPTKPALPVHVHLLVETGTYIMECMNLEPLAVAGVTRFTFVAQPLRIRGGTGSPIRPMAIAAR